MEKIREGYQLRTEIIDGIENTYLVEKRNLEKIVQIGDTKYTSLQEAIDSIETNEQTIIEVLTNFELNEAIIFKRNICLDLDGHTISNNYYKIENIGDLIITDSSEEKNGNIKSNVLIAIYNSIEGSLCVENISLDNNTKIIDSYGIYNESRGNVTVKGGTVSSSSNRNGSYSNSYGIYNAGSGIVTIEGGTVSSSNKDNSRYSGYSNSGHSYGIYNAGSGNVTVEGGTVSSSNGGYSYSYGIYNASSGNVEIKGGTVSSSDGNSGSSFSLNNSYRYGIYNASSGNVTIERGEVSSSGSYSHSYGIYNIERGNVTIEGGEVSSSSNGSYGSTYSWGIYNASSGNVIIEGGEVSSSSDGSYSSSSSYGIYNKEKGNIEIKEGTVSSSSSRGGNSYGIYNVITGNITIGIKGDDLVSSINPIIEASALSTYVAYGIYNIEGTLNFYDGKISGTTLAVYDTITNREENTELSYNVDKTELTLSEDAITLARIKNIEDEEYAEYTDLQEAINACESGQIIELLRGIEYTTNDEKLIIPQNKNVIIDLQGKKIISTIPNMVIQNNGNLEIRDSVGEGMIVAVKETTIYNENGATLTLNGGTVDNRETRAICNEGLLIIKEGTVNSGGIGNNKYSYGIYNASSGNVIIEGGTISSSYNNKESYYSYGIYNSGLGTVEIKGGTVSSNGSISSGYGSNNRSYGIYNAGNGNVEIKGGTVSSRSIGGSNKNNYSYGILNGGSGNVTVEGGTISSRSNYTENIGICNSGSGKIEIKRGIVSSEGNTSTGILNGANGDIEIKGGTVSGKNYGIYNREGNVTVEGGEVGSSGSSSICDGIYNVSSGNIEIKGGAVSGYGSGIYNLNSGNIEIKGGTVSGNNSGIKNSENGVLNYNDGIIKAKTLVITGFITKIAEGKHIVISDEEGYQVMTLENNIGNNVIIDDTEYLTVNKAIQALRETAGTIMLIKDTDMVEATIINTNQVITIDLNGHTLNNYFTIQNKGTLTIIDSSTEKTGKIVNNYNDTVIENTGTLNMNGGTISDATYAIKNNGILNVNGTVLNHNTYGIYMSSNATINITSGEISSNTYGIYNNYNGTVNIYGGKIESNDYGIYYEIYNNYNGIVNIYGGNIESNDYGVYKSGGTLKVFEGAEISSTNVGIQNASGTVYIGESGTVNRNSPIITGENYGLVNAETAYVYFYDGQIKGKQGATQGFITYTESGYRVANKQEGEYWIDYLALEGTVQTVAEVNGVSYSNLQSAINACSEGETITITLTNGIETDITFTISEGRTIILDMNEKTISSSAETTIINQGNLTIIDSTSSGVGKISNTNSNGTSINNSGTLALGTDDGTVSQNLITIEGETYGIINSGILNFYDGVIKGGSALSGTVTSMPSEYTYSTTTSGGKEMYFLTR